jgi:hypothetical protein
MRNCLILTDKLITRISDKSHCLGEIFIKIIINNETEVNGVQSIHLHEICLNRLIVTAIEKTRLGPCQRRERKIYIVFPLSGSY